jgi:hypothetical protein
MRPVRIFAAGFALTASSLLQPALSQDPIKIGVIIPDRSQRRDDPSATRSRKLSTKKRI